MDVDLAESDGVTPLEEICQQFNSLGTTDRDVLVSEMQKLIGPSITVTAAKFFLSMNDWNLQRALNTYLDVEGDFYDMAVIRGEKIRYVAPSVKFTHSWTFRNNGRTPWPSHSTRLVLRHTQDLGMFTESLDFQCPYTDGFPINRTVQPGEDYECVIELTAPAHPVQRRFTWQLRRRDNAYFGPVVHLTVVVDCNTQEIVDQLALLHTDD